MKSRLSVSSLSLVSLTLVYINVTSQVVTCLFVFSQYQCYMYGLMSSISLLCQSFEWPDTVL